ncbi:MAG: DnaD domain protein [Chloroflexi bacterium]|nr:DnaD domain protein [Chloroflexota bacterium]
MKKDPDSSRVANLPPLSFRGFPTGKVRLTPIPAPFFSELLPAIDHLGELKVILYALWFLNRKEGVFRFIRPQDFLADDTFLKGLGSTPTDAAAALEDSLQRAVTRGSLLKAEVQSEASSQVYYFLNSPRGRAAVEGLKKGAWQPDLTPVANVTLDIERPNIFRLYEEHIGPLTPMIAESLQEAEKTYPAAWIEDALRIAVENNVRRWRYVEAILHSWQEEGRDEQNRGDSQKDRRRYVEGKYADFIEH